MASGETPSILRQSLLNQFDLSLRLAAHHLDGLDMAACLWRPAAQGLHIMPAANGGWTGEWPDRETYDLGPASIGWMVWHLGYWLEMAIDHNFGDARLDRHSVVMPGEAAALNAWVTGLAGSWRARIAALPASEWYATTRTRWPFQARPLADLVAWANVELMKSAAEIGYGRFLHAVRVD